MTTSREAILQALPRPARASLDPPSPRVAGVRFPDPEERFARALAAAGGRCVAVPADSTPAAALRALPVFAGARRVLSGVAGVLPSGTPVHQGPVEELDLAILPGAPAVAESGAVWVVPGSHRLRTAAFLAQHLVLLVPRVALVHELHEAYARIDAAAQGFGCFVAGPSKTADIEQALVIGAHGPRSLAVILYGAGSGEGCSASAGAGDDALD